MMTAVDLLFSITCAVEFLLVLFNAMVIFLIIHGRWLITDEIRANLPKLIRRIIPKFKRKVSSRSLIFSVIGLSLLCIHQTFTALGMLTHFFSQSEQGCQALAQVMGFTVTGAYFCMLRIMIIRSEASRSPSDKYLLFEKALNIVVWTVAIFPLMLGFAPNVMLGTILPVDGNIFKGTCLIHMQNLVLVFSFSILDVFLSSSLLLLFYLRMRTLAQNDASTPRESRSEFYATARLNLKCSSVIIGSTFSITQIILFSRELQNFLGVYYFATYIYVSLALFIAIVAMILIFGNSYEWDIIEQEQPELSERGRNEFLLSSSYFIANRTQEDESLKHNLGTYYSQQIEEKN
jgi:hypothetical protein